MGHVVLLILNSLLTKAIFSSQGFSLDPPPFYIPKVRPCQKIKSFYTRVSLGNYLLLLVLWNYPAIPYRFPCLAIENNSRKMLVDHPL